MPEKEKLGEKVGIVRQYHKWEIGIHEASRAAGVDPATIREWIARYEVDGAEAFLPHERNRNYSRELKEAAVGEYLSGGGSLLSISKKYGLRSKTQLRAWIKEYNAHGDFNSVKHSGGGSYIKQGRSTTKEERLEIVRDCLASGKNYGEMAQKYQVSYQQVRTWTLHFEAQGEAGERRIRRRGRSWKRHRLKLNG